MTVIPGNGIAGKPETSTTLHGRMMRSVLFDKQTQGAQGRFIFAQLKNGRFRTLVVHFMLKLGDALWKFRAMYCFMKRKRP